VEALRRTGRTRPNWRGRDVAFPGGLTLLVAGAVGVALETARGAPSGRLARAAAAPVTGRRPVRGHPRDHAGPACLPPSAAGFALGAALLGLLDDVRGGGGPRGLRGHLAAFRAGRPSTGAWKALGTLGLAPLALPRGEPRADRALAALVLVLAAHAGNLLDLRPGRALKALGLLGAGLAARARRLPPAPLPALLAPCLVFLPLDLRERAMLGDTGAGLVGALAGMWLVAALGRGGRGVAAGLLAALAGYGETRSISARVEGTRGLRHLDSIGRVHA
jgi:hypothetical protein